MDTAASDVNVNMKRQPGVPSERTQAGSTGDNGPLSDF